MAREEALIISEELFQALSPVSGDLDWEYTWSVILAVQDKWIQPILGQDLYEKIMDEIKANTLADPYKALVTDYIARTCVWFTCYQGMPFWAIKIVNSGVVQRIVDDGAAITLNDIDKLREMCREQGEFYKQRLIDYLCANSKDFPELQTNTSGEVKPEAVNYQGGLNLEPYLKRPTHIRLKGWL
jgi:hypothetical protein